MATSPTMTLTEFRVFFRDKIAKAGGVRALARKLTVSAAHISDVSHGKREPGPTLLAKFRMKKTVQAKRFVTIERV